MVNPQTANRRFRRQRRAGLNALSIDDLIENKTKRVLTDDHRDALLLGFTFVPSASVGADRSADLTRFRRKLNLRLHHALGGKTSRRSIMGSFIGSDFQPPDYLATTDPLWVGLLNDLTGSWS